MCTCTFYIQLLSQCKCSHMTHLACALPLFVCHVSSAGTDWPALFRCLRTNQARAQFGGHGAHQLLPIIVIHVCSQKNISGSPQHTNIHIRRTLRIKSKRYLMSHQIADMRFVKNFTLPDFQAKNFTPLFSLKFNSFGDKNTEKWAKMTKFTLLAKILHCCRQWRQWQIPPLISI